MIVMKKYTSALRATWPPRSGGRFFSGAWQQKEASLPGPFSSQLGRPSRLVNAVTAFIFKSNHQIVDEAKWPTGVFRKKKPADLSARELSAG